jgi:hypothetical protein
MFRRPQPFDRLAPNLRARVFPQQRDKEAHDVEIKLARFWLAPFTGQDVNRRPANLWDALLPYQLQQRCRRLVVEREVIQGSRRASAHVGVRVAQRSPQGRRIMRASVTSHRASFRQSNEES